MRRRPDQVQPVCMTTRAMGSCHFQAFQSDFLCASDRRTDISSPRLASADAAALPDQAL